jgi:branched-chain amino acid transport system permease protein
VTRNGLVVRLAVVALLVAAPAVLDNYRTFLLTEILIFGLFAASVDLLLGYTGLPSLGQAGYFGVGGYAAGLLALHVTSNAFAQLAVALAAAAGVALFTGLFAVRSRGV